jgi:hypothetical protein
MYKFTVNTKKAMKWVKENVQLESYQWVSDKDFMVDQRCTHNLVDGLNDSGLTRLDICCELV